MIPWIVEDVLWCKYRAIFASIFLVLQRMPDNDKEYQTDKERKNSLENPIGVAEVDLYCVEFQKTQYFQTHQQTDLCLISKKLSNFRSTDKLPIFTWLLCFALIIFNAINSRSQHQQNSMPVTLHQPLNLSPVYRLLWRWLLTNDDARTPKR